MESNQESYSALVVSMMRAVHSRCDVNPIINDSHGFDLVSSDERMAMRVRLSSRLAKAGVRRGHDCRREDDALAWALRVSPGYGNVITRTRYAEDRLGQALRRGISQYVILGAGLDTFCFRVPDLDPSLRIFEIDHPATQAMKKKRLAAAGLMPPCKVSYIPVDFERETISEALRSSDFNQDKPAFFSWLGVSPYLTKQAHLDTIRCFFDSGAADSELVFNYLGAPVSVHLDAVPKARSIRSNTSEPIISRFNPQDVWGMLQKCGIEVVEDVGPAEIVNRYCSGRRDGLRPTWNFRIVHARRPL
jgi:methyltransferase (TIGR00027 family)